MSAVDEIMKKLKSLTLLEASELIKQIEEVFEVSAGGGGIPPYLMACTYMVCCGEVDDEFDVVLEEFPADKKIAILKVVRKLTGLRLKEAITFVESVPKSIKEAIPKLEAENFKKELEDVGATVSIKTHTVCCGEVDDEFDVVLEEFPADKKIAILKVVRKLTGLRLKEAITFVESVPKSIKESLPKLEAENFKKELEDVGATVSIKLRVIY